MVKGTKSTWRGKPRVVVLGGGFAGLESAFYLRHKLQDRVDITLISDSNYFVFKPNSIYVPFGEDPEKLRIDLNEPTRRKNIDFIRARAERIDPQHGLVHLPQMKVAFDYLIVATGAAMRPREVAGLSENAVTIWTSDDMMKLRDRYAKLVEAARGGQRQKLLFLIPPASLCPGPLYEMALMTDTWLREQRVRDNVEIAWSTFEGTYAQAFGPRLNPVLEEEFESRGHSWAQKLSGGACRAGPGQIHQRPVAAVRPARRVSPARGREHVPDAAHGRTRIHSRGSGQPPGRRIRANLRSG
jgi:NADPH-dependent 2,4-dienoyl-CoA reductase/sulfur reductase-like enzyme